MKLGMQVGLGPGHIMLNGIQLLPRSGTTPSIFGPCLLWPNGWMDQDVTWCGGRPRPRRHCVRWGSSSPPPPQKKAGASVLPCNFRPMSIVAMNDWMGEDATWYGSRPHPPKGAQQPPLFLAHVYSGQISNFGSYCTKFLLHCTLALLCISTRSLLAII